MSFHVCSAYTPAWQRKPGKAYRTADAAEIAARRMLASRGGEWEIYRRTTEGPTRPWNELYVATVLRDALDRVWTQVSHDGGRFL